MKQLLEMQFDNKNIYAALFLSVLFAFSVAGFAHETAETHEELDTAILTTDITSVDASVASAAGTKAGAPVLIAVNGELSADVKAALQEQGVKNVIIVGGPAVVKDSVESELKALGITVERVWDLERTGTAVEVARRFWKEGADCAVLVDDTKDSIADTDIQLYASNYAAQSDCPVIPIPQGAVPADVVELLSELGVNDVRHYANAASGAVLDALRDIPSRQQIKKDVAKRETDARVASETQKRGEKLRLVVVAAPNFKHTLGGIAHPGRNSVVRIISEVTSVAIDDLAGTIGSRGITNVKIVGEPTLAAEIATALSDTGTTVTITQVSGSDAAKASVEVLEKVRAETAERRAAYQAKAAERSLKIAAKVQSRLDNIEGFLEKRKAHMLALEEKFPSAKADIDAIIAKVDDNLAKVAQARQNAASAIEALASVSDRQFSADLWEIRSKVSFDVTGEVSEEESTTAQEEQALAEDVSAFRLRLAAIKEKCQDSGKLESLIEQAHALRAAAAKERLASRHAKAAEYLSKVRDLVETATSIGDLCAKTGRISESLGAAIEVQQERVEYIAEVKDEIREIRTRFESSGSSDSGTTASTSGTTVGTSGTTGTTTASTAAKVFTLEADDSAFFQSGTANGNVNVNRGDLVKITFKVRTTNVAFSGLTISGGSSFDAGILSPGAEKTVEFTAGESFTFSSFWPNSNVKKADGRVEVAA